jgi:hypothetical protein
MNTGKFSVHCLMAWAPVALIRDRENNPQLAF